MWLSHEVTSLFKVPHCFNHKCMWVWWKLSRHGSTWKNMAGRSIILFLCFFPVCTGRQTFVQTSFTEGTIWVPHCVSNMNTHGSFTVTMLCFTLECTRLIRCYVDTCRWAWCTFARLLIHEGRMVILFYTVFQTWTHYWGIKVDFAVLQSWMHREWYQYVFQSGHTCT